MAKSIRNAEDRRYVLAGFVSSDKKYLNKLLMGVRVVKNDLNLVEEMKQKRRMRFGEIMGSGYDENELDDNMDE